MEKRIKIEIGADGKINAETIGIKGDDCLKYIELLEKLLDAQTVDSGYTKEYYEANTALANVNKQIIKGE